MVYHFVMFLFVLFIFCYSASLLPLLCLLLDYLSVFRYSILTYLFDHISLYSFFCNVDSFGIIIIYFHGPLRNYISNFKNCVRKHHIWPFILPLDFVVVLYITFTYIDSHNNVFNCQTHCFFILPEDTFSLL